MAEALCTRGDHWVSAYDRSQEKGSGWDGPGFVDTYKGDRWSALKATSWITATATAPGKAGDTITPEHGQVRLCFQPPDESAP